MASLDCNEHGNPSSCCPQHFFNPAETILPSSGCINVVETSAVDVSYPKLNASVVTELPFKTPEVPLVKLRMTPETGRLGIKKKRGRRRGWEREEGEERAADDLFLMAIPYDRGLPENIYTHHKTPQERHVCSRGWNPEVITSAPYSKHGANSQFRKSSNYQRKVKNKSACLIQPTSTLH